MIKQQILNFLTEIENFQQLNSFFKFLIELKNAQHVSKDELHDTLMDILHKEEYENEFIYDMVADTLDYFVGWHAPLKESHPAYTFVQQLNS